jgi:hypothetical protein
MAGEQAAPWSGHAVTPLTWSLAHRSSTTGQGPI